MNVSDESYSQWLGGEKLQGFKFKHNDCVRISSGEHRNKTGSVVALYKLEENSPYTIEIDGFGDIHIQENQLEPINS